jgi:hypothetical protein
VKYNNGADVSVENHEAKTLTIWANSRSDMNIRSK